MNAHHKPAPDARVCSNCRYLSFTPGADLRCADPAASEFDRPVAAQGTCGRFQIGFAAAKLLAFRTSADHGAKMMQAWEMAMHNHLSAARTGLHPEH